MNRLSALLLVLITFVSLSCGYSSGPNAKTSEPLTKCPPISMTPKDPTVIAPVREVKTVGVGEQAQAIVADANWIFAIVSGRLIRISQKDQSIKVLLDKVDRESSLAMDKKDLFLASFGRGKVQRLAKTGGDPVDLIAKLEQPIDIQVDEDSVYVATELTGQVWRVFKRGGPPQLLAQAQKPGLTALVLDDNNVYFGGRGQELRRVSKKGGPLTSLGKNTDVLANMTSDLKYIYYAGKNGLFRISKDSGCGPELLLASPSETSIFSSIKVIRVDATQIYWATQGGQASEVLESSSGADAAAAGGAVARMPLAGGQIELVWSNPHCEIRGLTLTESHAYFTESCADGKILMTAK